jgi:hypothetical protein
MQSTDGDPHPHVEKIRVSASPGNARCTRREDLWKSYRVYCAGQAKLAFLKAQELEGDLIHLPMEKGRLLDGLNLDFLLYPFSAFFGHVPTMLIADNAGVCGSSCRELPHPQYGPYNPQNGD